jgi:uncharacterized membrane protein
MNRDTAPASRISSIDFLRGAVMIIMALDHTRDYFHQYSFYHNPADLSHTSVAIYFTRWITHFCAPVFVFLAGTSAFLSGQKKSKQELSGFLLKRGLWLLILEITVVSFGWFFNPQLSLFALQVIWVLGLSMILLAALVHLPLKFIFITGMILVFGHNLMDNVHVPGNTLAAFGWSQLHEFNVFRINDFVILSAYPVIPWVGVIALGYCFGSLYTSAFDAAKRRRILLITGSLGILVFILLRFINIYGDPAKWSAQLSAVYSFLSFLNTSKYPPSLLYLLMTLSPAFILLALSEKVSSRITDVISMYGRVPLFYYLLHIYLLHLLGMLLAWLTGFGWQKMIIADTWVTDQASLRGYGLSLPMVFLIWIIVVIALYPLCKKFDDYKRNNRSKWWLSYL